MSFALLESRLYTHRRKLKQTPELFNVDLGAPWELTGDWVIVGDVHTPTTEFDFAMLAAVVGRKMLKRPRRLLIAGDLFNMDSFSTYTSIVNPPTWAQERAATKELLKAWLDTFDEVRMILGNHDRRLQRFDLGIFVGKG